MRRINSGVYLGDMATCGRSMYTNLPSSIAKRIDAFKITERVLCDLQKTLCEAIAAKGLVDFSTYVETVARQLRAGGDVTVQGLCVIVEPAVHADGMKMTVSTKLLATEYAAATVPMLWLENQLKELVGVICRESANAPFLKAAAELIARSTDRSRFH